MTNSDKSGPQFKQNDRPLDNRVTKKSCRNEKYKHIDGGGIVVS